MISPPTPPAIIKNKIGVCVIGVGMWGASHCDFFRRASNRVELYVCGRNDRHTAKIAKVYQAKDYILGFDKAMEDKRFQAVSIVLPHDMHRKATELALINNKHVLLEKPIATSLEDADAMIELSKNTKSIFMIAENMHFRSAITSAVNAIDQGDIGEPLSLTAHAGGLFIPSQGWKADRDKMGGGVLIDIGVHYVRILRLILGDPDRVLCCRSMQVNTKTSGKDSVQLLFSSKLGWKAHLLLTRSSERGNGPDVFLFGDKGTLYLWPSRQYMDYFPALSPSSLDRFPRLLPSWLGSEKILSLLQRKRRKLCSNDTSGYLTEVREFLAAIEEGREPASTPQDARRDLEIILCAYESLAKDNWVNILPSNK